MGKNRHDWKVFIVEIIKGGRCAEDLVLFMLHVNGVKRLLSVKLIC